MREIKFRAWQPSRNRMLSVQGIEFDGIIGITVKYENTIPASEDFPLCGANGEPYLVLMQYTGLKDKNGVKIYEGDILHKDCFWPRFIEFEKGSFVSAPLNKVQYNNRKFYPIGCSDYQGWEVIGNIYENPELLEVRS